MNVLRVTASMDPTVGGPPQGIRNSIVELERLGIRSEVVCCDAPDAAWLGKDSFPVHALGPGKYGFAHTPKLGPWLEENLPRFDAVIVHGLWLWPSICATRAVARERARRKEQKTGHSRVCETAEGKLTRIDADKSERLAADRTGGECLAPGTPVLGGLSSETAEGGAKSARQPIGKPADRVLRDTQHLRCFVMPHGMLDPWFQRDKSRRVKAVRNWFYWWLVERGVVNSADALLFTCQQELELARTTFGGYRPKREINVGYGIAEPPAFEPKMQEAFSARCSDLHGRPYFLFMSRIHPKKNVAALVRAYARVRGEVTSDEWRVASDGTTQGPKDKGTNGLKSGALPDLVVAGPGWDSDYGREVRSLIDEANRCIASTENCQLPTANSACVHAVDMLQGDAKWGALYGCEAFVLPSHQENFGIAVVEALACGKSVLISDQVNICREIADANAGFVEADTEDGAVRLIKRFMARKDAPEMAERARDCYLSQFAIGPAVASLGRVLQEK